MSEPSKAVFLSYASQDAEPAKKICDSLRAAGVEVWFDSDGGLEQGDEWDRKIRGQIKACVLFIPVISANTQARHEGYFRIEWELATERAMGIAAGVPFLLPIVIDDTREPDALVPDRFRKVQWTRVPGGALTPAQQARLLKLWSHRTGVIAHESAKAAGAKDLPASVSAAESVGRPGAKVYALMAAGILTVVGALGWWFLGGRKPAVTPGSAGVSESLPQAPVVAPPAAVPVVAPSEARERARRAQALFESLDATRDDYRLAEEMIAQAKTKDATDPEVCAIEAHLHVSFIQRGWDTSDARRESAHTAVQRALRLDPRSFEARFAQARLLNMKGRDGEERERQLRELHGERPADRRILRALASTVGSLGRIDESAALARESAALPGGDPLALYNLSQAYWFAGRVTEAEAMIEASLAQQPFTGALLMNVWYKAALRGDIAQARALIERVRPAELLEDRAAFFAYLTEMFGRNPDKAIARLEGVPRDWLEDNWYRGPKGLLVGKAHRLAGRPEAARIEWEAALKVVEQRLAERPKDTRLLSARVQLLAHLGRRDEAEQRLPALLQIAGVDSERTGIFTLSLTDCYIALGRKAEAIREIAGYVKDSQNWFAAYPSARLRLDPNYDPLRGEPEFAAIVAEVEAREKAFAAPATPPGLTATEPAKADTKSVAVLAFANLSDDKDNEYFSDGISEELLTVLQKIPGLHVAARTSAFSFKGKNATAQEIGAKLGVANLVEGSVQKSGGRVKVTAHLSRAATGEELWSQSYTRELKDAFALQEELALAIVGELRGQLPGAGNAAAVKAAVKGGTTNPAAHEQYLQGRFHANRFSEEEMQQALVYLQKAVELDPSFALAWASVARVQLWYCQFSAELSRAEFDTRLAAARAAMERALLLEPALPEGLLARFGIQYDIDFDWNGAAESVRAGLALAPADPLLVSGAGQVASDRGDSVRGLQLQRQAVALDPMNSEARTYLAFNLLNAGKYEEARTEYAFVQQLNPAAPWAFAGPALSYVLEGKPDQALAVAEKESADWARLLVVALAHFTRREMAESDAALVQLTTKNADTAADQIAEVYAYRGEADRAFEWLERARRQHDAGLTDVAVDPLLAKLHADARWKPFLREMGLAPDQLK